MNPHPNTFQTPNRLVDEFMHELGGTPLAHLLVITRKTLGWSKRRDWISQSQMADYVGCSRSTTSRSVRSLLEKDLVDCFDGSGRSLSSPSDRRKADEIHYELNFVPFPEPGEGFYLPNTFQTPNRLVDQYLRMDWMTGSCLKCALWIIRKTLGYYKGPPWINHDELIQKTGLGQSTISESIDALIRNDLIRVQTQEGESVQTPARRQELGRNHQRLYYQINQSGPELEDRPDEARSSITEPIVSIASPTDSPSPMELSALSLSATPPYRSVTHPLIAECNTLIAQCNRGGLIAQRTQQNPYKEVPGLLVLENIIVEGLDDLGEWLNQTKPRDVSTPQGSKRTARTSSGGHSGGANARTDSSSSSTSDTVPKTSNDTVPEDPAEGETDQLTVFDTDRDRDLDSPETPRRIPDQPDEFVVDVDFEPASRPYKMTIFLIQKINEHDPMTPTPDPTSIDPAPQRTIQKWCTAMDRLHRLGPPQSGNQSAHGDTTDRGIEWYTIRRLITFLFDEYEADSSFSWRDQIESATGLRKKFHRIRKVMKRQTGRYPEEWQNVESESFDPSDPAFRAAKYLADAIEGQNPHTPIPDFNQSDESTVQEWAAEMNLLYEVGPPGGTKQTGYQDWDVIKERIDFAFGSDGFNWGKTIQSPSDLRDYFVRIDNDYHDYQQEKDEEEAHVLSQVQTL